MRKFFVKSNGDAQHPFPDMNNSADSHFGLYVLLGACALVIIALVVVIVIATTRGEHYQFMYPDASDPSQAYMLNGQAANATDCAGNTGVGSSTASYAHQYPYFSSGKSYVSNYPYMYAFQEGATCWQNSECLSGFCSKSRPNDNGYCTYMGNPGDSCLTPLHCRSGTCNGDTMTCA